MYTCLFCHYHPGGKLSGSVCYYLESLARLQVTILFISHSPLSAEARARLEAISPLLSVHERENKGFQFGAWQWALHNHLAPQNTRDLFLLTDSVIGPFHSLEAIVKDSCMPHTGCWGITAAGNEQRADTCLMCFSKAVMESDAFKKFFAQDFSNLRTGDDLVKKKILLSQMLSDAGYPMKWHPEKEQPGSQQNEREVSGKKMITPETLFLKKQFFQSHLEASQAYDEVFDAIKQITHYPVEHAENELAEYLNGLHATPVNPYRIDVCCHFYFNATKYYFLSRLTSLKAWNYRIIINLSEILYHDVHFVAILKRVLPQCILLHTPNLGRDIGGKLAALDVCLKLKAPAPCILVIHDKLSLHSLTGKQWRDKLLKIIEPAGIRQIVRTFSTNKQAGVITVKDFIKNEYDPDDNGFTSTNDAILQNKIREYQLRPRTYHYAAGTIFWVNALPFRNFFSRHPPLTIRAALESGNALDFQRGTGIHAWERLFSWVVASQNHTISGV